MKAINAVTQFFLGYMRTAESEKKPDAEAATLLDVYKSTRKQAKESGLDDEDADQVADKSATMAVMMNITFNIRELLFAVAKVGKVLCEISDPEMVAKDQPLMSPEELKKAAKTGASQLVMVLSVLQKLLPAVHSDVDDAHIAEQLLAFHREREAKAEAHKAAASVKAKPVQGSVSPLSKRWEPSQN